MFFLKDRIQLYILNDRHRENHLKKAKASKLTLTFLNLLHMKLIFSLHRLELLHIQRLQRCHLETVRRLLVALAVLPAHIISR